MTDKELRQSLRTLAMNYELGPAVDYIMAQAVPCVRFRDLGQYDDAPIGSTRFGGDPDMPVQSPWPTDPGAAASENALLFIAQFNLEELPLWRGCPLPKRGLLSIFLGINGFQGDAYVTYCRSTTRLERHTDAGGPTCHGLQGRWRITSVSREPFLGLSHPCRDQLNSIRTLKSCAAERKTLMTSTLTISTIATVAWRTPARSSSLNYWDLLCHPI